MPGGIAMSGSQSKSKQSSQNYNTSQGWADSGSKQKYDPLAKQIRRTLANELTGGANQPGPGIRFEAVVGSPTGSAVNSGPDGTVQTYKPSPEMAAKAAATRQARAANYGLDGPPITQGPIYTPEMTDRMLNLQTAKNNQATQGMIANIPQQLAGRGFASSGSPLAMELERRAMQQGAAQNAELGTRFPFEIAKENAQHLLATQGAAQGFYRQMQDEKLKRESIGAQMAGVGASRESAKLQAETSKRNALLGALTSLAQPLNRSWSKSGQSSFGTGSSFGSSESSSYAQQPYQFDDY